MKSVFLLLSILVSSQIYGQGIPIGQWHSYLPCHKVTTVTDNKILISSEDTAAKIMIIR